jgi:aconitate hydratase
VSFAEFPLAGLNHRCVDLPALARGRLAELPHVLRLLLENVARCSAGGEREAGIEALLQWPERRRSEAEILVQPGRVLMHDTTSTPALVDIAAMRDTLAEHGADPSALNPVLPVDVSVDHSLAVEAYGTRDAASLNMGHELRRNAERYRFLRWASGALAGVFIHPPGTGIMHTINLEQLATVVTTETRRGERWAVPDLMIGTDSHTPMVNGIGVLAWGVGGLEAQTVMFGMPTVLRVPEVIGVRLTNRLRAGVQSTDLALVVTSRLRALGMNGEFVEFFGPGVATLTAGDRCVVANMAPEYGATTGYFPIDDRTLDYLRVTGREESHVAFVEAYARRNGLWFDPFAHPAFTREIEIDLETVEMHIAGPRRPQDLHVYNESAAVLRRAVPSQAHFPIAIAAITSCTNTTDARLLITAGLLARKARAAGLQVAEGVKTSLAPGSPSAARYLARAGLDADLEALGFAIVGYGCTTCIGNSGPLGPGLRRGEEAGAGHKQVAVLSGNRNFPGRVHPDLDLALIMSPALVVAFALAGDAAHDLRDEPLVAADGRHVMLGELWPSADEVDSAVADAVETRDFAEAFEEAGRNPEWHRLDAPTGERFPWRRESTILRRPPFASLDEGSLLGKYRAHPLLVLGDDITTDHISPASAIPPDSLVADFLVERGEPRGDLNVFASRRGNWEVMLRGAFHSKAVLNLLAPDAPVAHTVHAPSGDVVPLAQAADRYRAAGEAVVLVAGERYGMGSSRDWAAKAQRLLGIRAVLAISFERIHRSNLVGMGILPLVLPGPLLLSPGDMVEIDAPPELLAPRGPIAVRIVRANGSTESLATKAAVETAFEVALLREGGVLPHILRSTLQRRAA